MLLFQVLTWKEHLNIDHMQLYSTNNKSNVVGLEEAVMNAFPVDKGLYMPSYIPQLPVSFFEKDLEYMSFNEIALAISSTLFGNAIKSHDLQNLIESAFDFDAPVVFLEEDMAVLELFHGPSMAFKDFGARFMSKLMAHYNREKKDLLTILVATSGDTGGAVAAGFYNTPGIEVVILYPKGKVSDLQEKQLTTWGKNITACEIEGTFDDCQAMVKKAFIDPEVLSHYRLSSANSINIARLVPQTFYYVDAYRQVMESDKKIVASVPSGNFGNLTAGLIARKMGLPIHHFLAATNINKIVPDYLNSGIFDPKASLPTISNAMDVGNPSNFDRMLALYNGDLGRIRKDISGYFYTDEQTKSGMRSLYEKFNYISDPHGAIGWLALHDYRANNSNPFLGIFLETAHPAKFIPTVENALDTEIPVPEKLDKLRHKEKKAHLLESDYDEFRSFLLDRRLKTV